MARVSGFRMCLVPWVQFSEVFSILTIYIFSKVFSILTMYIVYCD